MKWILLVLIAGLGGSIFYNKHLESELKKEEKRQRLEEARLSQLENEVQSKKSMVAQELTQEQQALGQLKLQLENKQTQRASLADRLNTAKNFNNGDQRLSTTQFDLQHEKENVANIENQLKGLVAQRESVDGQNKYSLEQRRVSYQNDDLVYGQNILIEQQKLKQMNDQYNSLRGQRNNLSSLEQARQMPAQIQNEKLYIQKLQLDRQALKTNWEATKNSYAQGGSGSPSDLKNQEAVLKAQLQQEKNNLRALEDQQKNQSGSLNSQKNEISSIQNQISNLDSDIRSLQDQIKTKQARINELSAAKP